MPDNRVIYSNTCVNNGILYIATVGCTCCEYLNRTVCSDRATHGTLHLSGLDPPAVTSSRARASHRARSRSRRVSASRCRLRCTAPRMLGLTWTALREPKERSSASRQACLGRYPLSPVLRASSRLMVDLCRSMSFAIWAWVFPSFMRI